MAASHGTHTSAHPVDYLNYSPASQQDALSTDTSPGTQVADTSSTDLALSDQNDSANAGAADGRPTISTACLACRSKHLKCDGQRPCSRCLSSGSDCAFVASRRGYKGPRRAPAKNPAKRQAETPPDVGFDVSPTAGPASGGTSQPLGMCPFGGRTSGGGSTISGSSPESSSTPGPTSTAPSSVALSPPIRLNNAMQAPLPSLAERCIDSFYRHFHASHPFVLPKRFLLPLSTEGTIEPLLAAIRWVGSLFIDVVSSRGSLYDEAYQRIRDPSARRDGFLVQALMVMIVGLDGSCQQDTARQLLEDTEKLAVEIALNTRPYAGVYGRGMPILEESWRRTWWDLFIIDGMIAGVHRVTNFALFDVPADVALPCEERDYLNGTIPTPARLEDLEDLEFADDDDRQFSSFSYRILCGRNLGKSMRTPPITGPDDPNLPRIEALLTNWRLHLPASKIECLDRDGNVDEMMFQAHMMLNATAILLHQPHSQLDSSPAQSVTSCAPHQPIASGDTFNAHTRHTVSAAANISNLITKPAPLLTHTHFFTCVITLSSIVHLSKWALPLFQYDDDDLRQQIRLNIGALNHLSQVWSAADKARGQVKGVARDIYQAKKEVQSRPEFWFGFTREQMLRSVQADQSIIEEVESGQTLLEGPWKKS